MRKILFLVCFVVFLGGCSSSPVDRNFARSPEINRVFVRDFLVKRDGYRSVLFVRDSGLVGSGSYHHVFIDGAHSFSLLGREAVEVFLPPGKINIMVGASFYGYKDYPSLYGSQSIDLDSSPNMRFVVRTGVEANRGIILKYHAEPL